MEFHEMIRPFVEAQVRAHYAAVEKACEAALQNGTCGVLVRGDCDARPDSRVPYGLIWDATACPDKFPIEDQGETA